MLLALTDEVSALKTQLAEAQETFVAVEREARLDGDSVRRDFAVMQNALKEDGDCLLTERDAARTALVEAKMDHLHALQAEAETRAKLAVAERERDELRERLNGEGARIAPALAAERAKVEAEVVAYLRSRPLGFTDLNDAPEDGADAIERGEHRTPAEKEKATT